MLVKQGKSERFHSCDRPSNLKLDSNRSYSPETLNSGQNGPHFVPYDIEICWITSENNWAPLLYHITLCASFQIHLWSQAWVTVRKRLIWVKIGDFLSRMTFKFEIWPWKIIGHIFYTTLSFVHHCKAISEFKLELQSGNTQFGSKSVNFLSRVTLKFDTSPWKTIGQLSYAASSFLHHFIAIQTGVTVRKRPIWAKIHNFLAVWPWDLTDDLE